MRNLFIIISLLFIFCSKGSTQENAISTDLIGTVLYPLITSKADNVENVYLANIYYERALSRYYSLLFCVEKGKIGIGKESHSYFQKPDLYETKVFNLSLEFREYYSKRKEAPFGLFGGFYYKHYFIKESYFSNTGILNNTIDRGNSFAVGGTGGYKFGNKFFVEPVFFIHFQYISGLDSFGDIITARDFWMRFYTYYFIKLSIGVSF